MKKLIISVFMICSVALTFTACGGSDGGSDSSSPVTISDYEKLIADTQAELATATSDINSTFWGKDVDFYAFDFNATGVNSIEGIFTNEANSTDEGWSLSFTNSDYGQEYMTSLTSNSEITDKYSYAYYNTSYFNSKIDNENNTMEVILKYEDNDLEFKYTFTPNTIETLEPRVQGDYSLEVKKISTNEILETKSDSFTTTRDGRETEINHISGIANTKISGYEGQINIIEYNNAQALLAQQQAAQQQASSSGSSGSSSSSDIKTCGSNSYVLNATAKQFAGTYHLATNTKSTFTLSSSGTGSKKVYELSSLGQATNTVDYDISITSWGLKVDSSGSLVVNSSGNYYLITASNSSGHECKIHSAKINGSSITIDYWY